VTVLRYQSMAASGLAWAPLVPAHWRVLEIKRIAALRSGDAITAERITDAGDYPVFGGGGPRGYTDSFTHDGHFVIIGRQGALCGNVNYGSGRFWASEHAVVATPTVPMDTKWFGETLRSMNLNQHSVSAAQPGLSVDTVSRLRLPVPPLNEQRGIASFIERQAAKIDELVAEQERLMVLLREKRQAVISHAVTKGLNPVAPKRASGVQWLGEVPSHWTVVPIRKVARLESGHTPSRQHPEYWQDCNTPWFTLADVWQIRETKAEYVYETKELISEVGLANSSARLLPAGTVMLSRTASVGFSTIMGVPMATTQDFANWICTPRLSPDFLLFVLRSMSGEFRRLMMGSTHNTIYMPDIQSLTFALPPRHEQDKIVQYIRDSAKGFDDLSAQSARAADLLRERRAALISAAVTGEIDVRHLATTDAA
jgi:type I restriction enzyme, S subunit